jgi:hypothetical protein
MDRNRSTAMAEEGLLDRAIGLIPGVGGARLRKRPPSIKRQVAQLQRNLLKLTEDVEGLCKLIASTPRPGKRRAARRGKKAKATQN